MVILCKDCSPCCEFCLYARKKIWFANGKQIKVAIEGCNKHNDEHHQSMAQYHGYCLSFHCNKMEENSSKS